MCQPHMRHYLTSVLSKKDFSLRTNETTIQLNRSIKMFRLFALSSYTKFFILFVDDFSVIQTRNTLELIVKREMSFIKIHCGVCVANDRAPAIKIQSASIFMNDGM